MEKHNIVREKEKARSKIPFEIIEGHDLGLYIHIESVGENS